jgi:hypothetical protein
MPLAADLLRARGEYTLTTDLSETTKLYDRRQASWSTPSPVIS